MENVPPEPLSSVGGQKKVDILSEFRRNQSFYMNKRRRRTTLPMNEFLHIQNKTRKIILPKTLFFKWIKEDIGQYSEALDISNKK